MYIIYYIYIIDYIYIIGEKIFINFPISPKQNPLLIFVNDVCVSLKFRKTEILKYIFI